MRPKYKVHPNKGHADSVISYIGGKTALIGNITPVLEFAIKEHSLSDYYEVCGGGGRMLLSLEYSQLTRRVYNEIDEGLYALFSCLTSSELTYELMELLESWGISEERYSAARDFRLSSRLGDEGYNLVTAAACTYVVTRQSRAATMRSFNRSLLIAERSRSYYKKVRNLDSFLPTMSGVQTMNRDVIDILHEQRDWCSTLIYIDPPYTTDDMRSDKHYRVNWSNADHEKLVDILLNHQGDVVLSGYDTPIYDRLVAKGWSKIFLKRLYVASSAVSGRFADEYLYLNFDIPSYLYEQISEFDYSGLV